MLRTDSSAGLAASESWQAILGRYPVIGLDDVADAATSDRTDTKFILHADVIESVLAGLSHQFGILDIDGWRYTAYRTQYFDTESYALFRCHHIGGANRYKVRARTYLNTGAAFIEIKRRSGNGATTKLRKQIRDFQTELTPEAGSFVDEHSAHPAASLVPVLCNSFSRITLLSNDGSERLTVDLDVAVESELDRFAFTNVAVAELKQKRGLRQRDSVFLQAMRNEGVRPSGFSKYCMGLLLTRPQIKHNLFKPQVRRLRRLMGEQNATC